MAGFINLEELEALAKAKLPKMIYDYYAGGANSQWTVGENRAAFSQYRLLPRMLVDVSKLSTSTSILGEAARAAAPSQAGRGGGGGWLAALHAARAAEPGRARAAVGYPARLPVMVAPMAMHGMAHPDRELATACAAAAAGIPMVRGGWAPGGCGCAAPATIRLGWAGLGAPGCTEPLARPEHRPAPCTRRRWSPPWRPQASQRWRPLATPASSSSSTSSSALLCCARCAAPAVLLCCAAPALQLQPRCSASCQLGAPTASAPRPPPARWPTRALPPVALPRRNRQVVQSWVQEAEALGYKAIMVTVDAQRLGYREADERNRWARPPAPLGAPLQRPPLRARARAPRPTRRPPPAPPPACRFQLPAGLELKNLDLLQRASRVTQARDAQEGSGLHKLFACEVDDSLSWDFIPWLRSITRLPIWLKVRWRGGARRLGRGRRSAGALGWPGGRPPWAGALVQACSCALQRPQPARPRRWLALQLGARCRVTPRHRPGPQAACHCPAAAPQGLLAPEDAELAVQHGVDAIVVRRSAAPCLAALRVRRQAACWDSRAPRQRCWPRCQGGPPGCRAAEQRRLHARRRRR
jgi:isopentenyl diphosphate isomerase/L-lactate dehydrogenase-like FMN-dependent dehydrogenase